MDLTQLKARLGDRYDISRELGRGGMGAVYLARDVKLNRPVALKVLPAEMAEAASLRDRFLRETRTAASFCSDLPASAIRAPTPALAR